MDRDNQLIAILRRVASGKRVAARRRLEAIDALAALDCVYFTEPTNTEYKQAPARSRTLIYRFLRSLLNGDKEQIRGRVGDRLRFMRGYNVAGLYRAIGDPLTKSEVMEDKPDLSTVAGIRAAVEALVTKGRK